MDLIIGNSHVSTTVESEHRTAVIAPDKGDTLILILGINRVEVEHIDGSWTISHGRNVVSNEMSQTDSKAFSAVGTNLKDELASR